MKDAGYVYINIDDTWEGETRDAQGNITSNKKFPDMKALADYVHRKGLKLGIYTSPGPNTCAGYEGTYGTKSRTQELLPRWGIDYVKYDCAEPERFIYERGHARRLSEVWRRPAKNGPPDRLQPMPVRQRRSMEVGKPMSAATSGARRAISAITGRR